MTQFVRVIRVKTTIEHFREIDPDNVRQAWVSKPIHHVSRGGTAYLLAVRSGARRPTARGLTGRPTPGRQRNGSRIPPKAGFVRTSGTAKM